MNKKTYSYRINLQFGQIWIDALVLQQYSFFLNQKLAHSCCKHCINALQWKEVSLWDWDAWAPSVFQISYRHSVLSWKSLWVLKPGNTGTNEIETLKRHIQSKEYGWWKIRHILMADIIFTSHDIPFQNHAWYQWSSVSEEMACHFCRYAYVKIFVSSSCAFLAQYQMLDYWDVAQCKITGRL